MSVFLAILAMLAWMGAIVWLICRAMELNGPAHRPMTPIVSMISACILFALPFGIAASISTRDSNANRLCVSGHERWVSVHHAGYLLGGKVYMPAYDTTEKRWFCEQWESR